jgi:hypothetical protein
MDGQHRPFGDIEFESVTTTATSMMRSVSGCRPVISMSSQTRLFSLLTEDAEGLVILAVRLDMEVG